MKTRFLLFLFILTLCCKTTTAQETMTLSSANEAYNAGNYQKAVSIYKTFAEQGDVIAQCNLGYCYEFGKGVEKSIVQAAKWYVNAAEQGHDKAIKALESLGDN